MKKQLSMDKIIEAAGGGPVLARQLINPHTGKSLTHQAVYAWNHVPAGHVLKVAEITGIPRHRIRPDIYPDD